MEFFFVLQWWLWVDLCSGVSCSSFRTPLLTYSGHGLEARWCSLVAVIKTYMVMVLHLSIGNVYQFLEKLNDNLQYLMRCHSLLQEVERACCISILTWMHHWGKNTFDSLTWYRTYIGPKQIPQISSRNVHWLAFHFSIGSICWLSWPPWSGLLASSPEKKHIDWGGFTCRLWCQTKYHQQPLSYICGSKSPVSEKPYWQKEKWSKNCWVLN